MVLRKFSYLLAAALTLGAVQSTPAQEFFLKKGDVVVVMGDSITEQRLYSNYLELWSQTRFPAYNLVFRNVGIGGDTSGGGNGRFKRDVLAHKPTVLTVDFGMNDGGYIWPGKLVNKTAIADKDVDARLANYLKGHQGIAKQAKDANLRVAWITPQPVEAKPGDEFEKYNQTLEKFSAGLADLAKKSDGLFVDQFHPYWAVVEKARKSGEKGRITGGDAVHPGAPGQALMAASILKGLGFNRFVSSASLEALSKDDGKGKGAISSVNCKISDAIVKGNGASFVREDAALPYFPEPARSILKWTPLLEEMNYYGLQVSGLKAGKYDVSLDGVKIATFSDAELAKGVNLAEGALAKGPVAEQVKDVVKAVTDKTNYYHGKIYAPLVLGRDIAKNPDLKDVAKEDLAKRREALVAERMKEMPTYDAAIRKALEPRAHRVEIAPAK